MRKNKSLPFIKRFPHQAVYNRAAQLLNKNCGKDLPQWGYDIVKLSCTVHVLEGLSFSYKGNETIEKGVSMNQTPAK